MCGQSARMPALLPVEAARAWLDPAAEPAALVALLLPPPDDAIEMHRVTKAMGSPAHAGPDCVAPLPEE